MIKHALLFTFVSAACAQSLLIGVKGGVPVLDTTPYGGGESKPYNVGPSVEVGLPHGFAIEADALYQRVGQSGSFFFAQVPSGPQLQPIAGAFFSRMRGNSWQFPILAKRYFRTQSGWQPFVSLGPSIRHVSYQYDTNEAIINAGSGLQSFTGHSENPGNWSVGATAAVGALLRKGRLAFLPEFRYTRWAQNNGSVLSRNAAGAFLGVSF